MVLRMPFEDTQIKNFMLPKEPTSLSPPCRVPVRGTIFPAIYLVSLKKLPLYAFSSLLDIDPNPYRHSTQATEHGRGGGGHVSLAQEGNHA